MAIGENYVTTKTRYVFLQSIHSKLMVSIAEISVRVFLTNKIWLQLTSVLISTTLTTRQMTLTAYTQETSA